MIWGFEKVDDALAQKQDAIGQQGWRAHPLFSAANARRFALYKHTKTKRPMVEVFATNVQHAAEAKTVLALLQQHFPGTKINFDLQDCDKILRVEGENICPSTIAGLVKETGFACDVLE